MLLCLKCTKAEFNYFNIVTPWLYVGECLNFGACEMISGKKYVLVVGLAVPLTLSKEGAALAGGLEGTFGFSWVRRKSQAGV